MDTPINEALGKMVRLHETYCGCLPNEIHMTESSYNRLRIELQPYMWQESEEGARKFMGIDLVIRHG